MQTHLKLSVKKMKKGIDKHKDLCYNTNCTIHVSTEVEFCARKCA